MTLKSAKKEPNPEYVFLFVILSCLVPKIIDLLILFYSLCARFLMNDGPKARQKKEEQNPENVFLFVNSKLSRTQIHDRLTYAVYVRAF